MIQCFVNDAKKKQCFCIDPEMKGVEYITLRFACMFGLYVWPSTDGINEIIDHKCRMDIHETVNATM